MALVVGLAIGSPVAAASGGKLDRTLSGRAGQGGSSRVIVTLKPGSDPSGEVKKLGGRVGRRLGVIDAIAADVPNGQLQKLAQHPGVDRIDLDRPTTGVQPTVISTTGARLVHQSLGLDGAGIGVAVIDSGVTEWHDDLTYTGTDPAVRVAGGQRVSGFVDFVGGQSAAYDDYGHGTHVAGIIAGNGYDSRGTYAGVAPAAHLLSLKVLDGAGRGVISDVIAALDYAVAHRAAHNIRIINLSVGAAVTSSYTIDPLTLAAKRAVDAGIVVVTAAGNLGRNQAGDPQYGGITAPGNAPWVLTVGASSHEGTASRHDDVVAPYSSLGPSAIDYAAKPDITAPGTGIVSLSDPSSAFYQSKSDFLVDGSFPTGYKPYLSLTGTSMAAPVVSGTVALMLQANPSLTPNLVKAMLQYTARAQSGVDPLAQGAGFVNARGAVTLAGYFAAAAPGSRYPHDPSWSTRIHWGNQRITGGAISPMATAWETGVIWGSAHDTEGDNIVWGTLCDTRCRNIVWGTAANEGDNIVWGTSGEGDNIVWGTASNEGDNIVWGTVSEGDNIVWGTASEGDNIVWGTDCGGGDCFNIVWGTATGEGDNIVWGTAAEGDNIVWGTSGTVDPGAWGTAVEGANIVWGTSDADQTKHSTNRGRSEARLGPPPALRNPSRLFVREAL